MKIDRPRVPIPRRRVPRRGVPIRGAVVVITGGASGIGLEMALECARRGARAIAIWDLDEEAGRAAATRLGSEAKPADSAGRAASSGIAKFYRVDVTDSASVTDAAAQSLADFGRVDVLINNAGVVTGKDFLDLTDDDVRQTFEVNTLSHYRTTREFLPGMLERDRGAIVTIASAAGLVGVARQTDYSASKFGAVGFAESLRAELRHRGSNVHTLLYCPYYISTGMFDGVKTKVPALLPILEPADAGRQVIDALEAGHQLKVAPPFVKAVQFAKGLPVPILDRLLDLSGINETMDDFVGRSPSRAG